MPGTELEFPPLAIDIRLGAPSHPSPHLRKVGAPSEIPHLPIRDMITM